MNLTVIRPTLKANANHNLVACEICQENCLHCNYIFNCNWYNNVNSHVPIISLTGRVIGDICITKAFRTYKLKF